IIAMPGARGDWKKRSVSQPETSAPAAPASGNTAAWRAAVATLAPWTSFKWVGAQSRKPKRTRSRPKRPRARSQRRPLVRVSMRGDFEVEVEGEVEFEVEV